MKTTRGRNDEKRQQKLADLQEQIESGSLVVRKMTPAERKRYPPRPRKPRR